MEKLMDMHVHTTYSDGEFTPKEIIQRAIKNNVGVMAITDHDTINGVRTIDRNEQYIKDSGIKVIDGIEVSCKYDDGAMHVLGYDYDLDNEDLNKWLDKLRTDRMNATLSVMEQIKRDYGIVFSYQDIIDMVNKNNVGRPDLARLCIRYGFCDSVDEAFNLFLNPAKRKVQRTNRRVSYSECFKLIKDSGGIAVLAHPKSLNLDKLSLDRMIYDMKECGLDGIEVFHSSFNKDESDYYLSLAEKYDLLISGGSDYHGPLVKPDIELGIGKGNLKIKKLSLVDELFKRGSI